MGLKKTNYEVKNMGVLLPQAYAALRKLDRYGDSGYAELWVHNSRENALSKNYLERHSVSFKTVDGKNPYEAAYKEAIKRPVRTEVYYVDPVTGEELAERSEGAERKTREVIDPAILDGWENDIV
nr:MAG TPA: hypothetical protein [Caudoviricetes sp.]